MRITEDLVEFIAKIDFKDLTEPAVSEAKKCFLDGIGVTLAGSRDEATKILRNFVSGLGGKPQASTIGMDAMKASVVQAALINGVASHVLDFDDTQNILGGHPTAVILPVVLATGEYVRATGRDVLTSFILGIETSCKIARGVNPYHYQSGYHVTSTIGIFGAAASAGKLLGLNPKEFLSALGIAGSMSSGLKENFGTMTKSLHAGLAASNGIAAVLLAKGGVTASEKILEGDLGFGNVLSQDRHFERMIRDLGNPWEIEDPGITRKKYPSCARTHPAIDALLKILKEHPISYEDLEEIEVATDHTAFEILIHPDPKSPLEAKFSMPYCLAVAFLEKGVSIHHFDAERLRNPLIVATMKKVNHIPDAKISSKGFEHRGTSRVKVRLKKGKEFFQEVEKSKGHPANPLTDDEIANKFHQCAHGIFPSERIQKIVRRINRLEDETDISSLLNDLALPGPL